MIIIPVGVDYKAERYPVVTFTLIGLNVVVFAGQLAAFASGGGAELYQTFGLVPADHGIWACSDDDGPAEIEREKCSPTSTRSNHP